MMLMSQMGVGGVDPAAGGTMMSSMMQMMMTQKLMGGKSEVTHDQFFTRRGN
jgi:hypothetical protein